jgi:hypothetical protein
MPTSWNRIVWLPFVPLAVACARTPSASSAAGRNACPDVVQQSIAKSYPTATVTACKAEHEVDVAPDGAVLQTEVVVALDQVPEKVMTAFAAKYPGATPTRAEKQVRTGKGTFYELAFPSVPKQKEATFAEDGSFVEDE